MNKILDEKNRVETIYGNVGAVACYDFLHIFVDYILCVRKHKDGSHDSPAA